MLAGVRCWTTSKKTSARDCRTTLIQGRYSFRCTLEGELEFCYRSQLSRGLDRFAGAAVQMQVQEGEPCMDIYLTWDM